MGSLGVGHDWVTSLLLFTFMHWRRKWQPTPVFLPGESQGRGSLVVCRPWDHKESDTTERLTHTLWVLPCTDSIPTPLWPSEILYGPCAPEPSPALPVWVSPASLLGRRTWSASSKQVGSSHNAQPQCHWEVPPLLLGLAPVPSFFTALDLTSNHYVSNWCTNGY